VRFVLKYDLKGDMCVFDNADRALQCIVKQIEAALYRYPCDGEVEIKINRRPVSRSVKEGKTIYEAAISCSGCKSTLKIMLLHWRRIWFEYDDFLPYKSSARHVMPGRIVVPENITDLDKAVEYAVKEIKDEFDSVCELDSEILGVDIKNNLLRVYLRCGLNPDYRAFYRIVQKDFYKPMLLEVD
jgi:hypothetical protein